MKRLPVFTAFLLFITGCGLLVPFQARVNHKFAEVLKEWRGDYPDADLTPEIEAMLRAKAEDRAHNEENTERDEFIGKASEATSKFGSGNFIGGGIAVISLAFLALGARKKRKEIKEAITVEQQIEQDAREQRIREEALATTRSPDDTPPPAGTTPDGASAAGGGSPS